MTSLDYDEGQDRRKNQESRSEYINWLIKVFLGVVLLGFIALATLALFFSNSLPQSLGSLFHG